MTNEQLKNELDQALTRIAELERQVKPGGLDEKFYWLIFDHAAIPAVMTKMPEATFTDVNEAFEQFFGYRKEDVIGKTSLELGMVRPEERARTMEEIKTSGTSRDAERRFFTKNGEERVVSIYVNTFEYNGSTYAITTMHDITERMKMESSLKRQANLLELAHDSIIILDMEGRSTYWNRGAEERYGWTKDEALGQVIHNLLKTEFPISLQEVQQELIQHSFWEGELIHTRRDGSQIIVDSRWQLQRENGQPSAILEINNDITARKKAERELARKNEELTRLYSQTEHRLENLSALRTIDIAIASSFDLEFTLRILLEQTIKRIGAEAADVLLFEPVTNGLHLVAQVGFRTPQRERIPITLKEGLAWQVIRDRKTLTVQDLREQSQNNDRADELLGEGLQAYKGVPLIAKGMVRGVMEVFQHNSFDLENEQRSFLDALAGQAAIAIDSAQLFENLQKSNIELRQAYDKTIEGWSHAMDLRDKETEGHSLRVTERTVRLAARLGATPDELVQIRRGALLHDMGKLAVPDEVLRKPGPLTDEEWAKMRCHPQWAYEMLSRIDYLQPSLEIPYCHHEKWDGSGYPRGLIAEQIPMAARVFAVIDVWDALTSDRVYRQAWPREKALDYMREQAGKHFDPQIVDVFLSEQV